MEDPRPTPSRPGPSTATPAYEGLRLLSGTGEDLGVIVGVERDGFGVPKWLTFIEMDGTPPRKVRLEFVRGVADGCVRLAGPREGYHITRIH